MMEYLQYFFSPAHLWSLRPDQMSFRAALFLAVVFGIFLLLGVVAKFKSSASQSGLDKKGWDKWLAYGLTIGILGYLYTFFAYQAVTLLAARFWLLLLAVTAALWGFFILKYFKVEVPRKKQDITQRKNLQKYIP